MTAGYPILVLFILILQPQNHAFLYCVSKVKLDPVTKKGLDKLLHSQPCACEPTGPLLFLLQLQAAPCVCTEELRRLLCICLFVCCMVPFYVNVCIFHCTIVCF